MIERFTRRWVREPEVPAERETGSGALVLAMVIIGSMGVALAVDAASQPALAGLTVIAIGSLLAALALYG